jgi:D-alanyl-D-alanine carboxypeptidase (penicillin-binding protein 5/6)
MKQPNPIIRRLAALVAAFVMGASTAGAAGHRFPPARELEDGAPAGPDEAIPTATETKAQPLELKSPSAVLIEASSGRVLYEKNARERRNPASVTKVMTLIIAFDALRDGKVRMEDKVTVSEEAAKQPGTSIFADTGETFTLAELLKSVAVGSANDASVAVAEHVAGSVEAFVEAMNAKARELGMNDTQFRNPTGLSADGHFTTAYDIALMSRYAAVNYPELIRLTSIYGEDLKVPWRKNGPTFRLWNNNKLLTWYKGADGLKTGWTEAAGYCLAATALRGDVRMISVIMGADSWKVRNAEAAKLLDYGFANYTAVELAPKGKVLGSVPVMRGRKRAVEAVPKMRFAVGVAKGEQGKVKTEVKLAERVEAPVTEGQVIGEIVAAIDGREVARMPLVAARAVERANLWQMIGAQVRNLFTIK